jgi:hypothetical protein
MMFNVIHVFRNCLIVQRDDVSKHQQRDDIRLELSEVSTEIGRVAHPCASTGVGAPSFRALCERMGHPQLGQRNRSTPVYWQNLQVTWSWLGTKIAI